MEKIRYFAKPNLQATFAASNGGGSKDSTDFHDISDEDCSFHCNGSSSIEEGTHGILKLNLEGTTKTDIDAVVARNLDGRLSLTFKATDNSKYFSSPKTDRSKYENRKKRQIELANVEQTTIHNEIRQMKECQLRLFVTCFTISIAITSLLIVSKENRFATKVILLMAIAPAGISAIFAILSIQKACSLNRITSFLTILKQKLIGHDFSNKYLGFENTLNNMYACKSMRKAKWCGKGKTEQDRLQTCADVSIINAKEAKKSIISIGNSFLFTLIISVGYITIFSLSLIATINMSGIMSGEIIGDFKLGIGVTLFTLVLGGLVALFGYHVQSGRHSYVRYFYLWEEIMTHCDAYHPHRSKQK